MKTDDEMTSKSELKKFAVELIHAHYDVDGGDGFRKVSDEVAKWFEGHGDFQLASYVRVLNGREKEVFIPM